MSKTLSEKITWDMKADAISDAIYRHERLAWLEDRFGGIKDILPDKEAKELAAELSLLRQMAGVK